MSRIEHLARTYWFDLLIALLAIMAMLEVVLARGSSGAPTTTLWFCLPALAILVLPLFARRWFPFAGPVAFWLLAAGISFVDPLLIPYPESLFAMQLVAAFLLGNLRDVRRAGLGLAIMVGAAATAHVPSLARWLTQQLNEGRCCSALGVSDVARGRFTVFVVAMAYDEYGPAAAVDQSVRDRGRRDAVEETVPSLAS